MQQTQTLTVVTEHTDRPLAASRIPKIGHAEAAELATAELNRFLAVLESLDGADWEQPTACTLWNVRQVAAHEAGWLWGTMSWSHMYQLQTKRMIGSYRARGMSLLDSVNQAQVDRRAQMSPAEIIAEIRQIGPRAIGWRKSLPRVVRAIRLPMEDLGGLTPIGYLMDTIYSRDMWMHRLDICRATGREFVQTVEHDGRLAALVVRDYDSPRYRPDLGGKTILLELGGVAGGRWLVGDGHTPSATIRMDVCDFNLLASGRLTSDAVRARALAQIEGDTALAQRVLDTTSVPY